MVRKDEHWTSGDGECELRCMNVTRTTKAGDNGYGADTLGEPESRLYISNLSYVFMASG